ncbi:MAG: OB-fold nucleic acid binding domain-containing protein, partial [Ignavibacteria bacterium]
MQISNKLTEISYLKGVGPKRAKAFEKLGIKYAEDLFNVYPRDYIVNTKISQLKNYNDRNVLIFGEVKDKQAPRKPNHPTRLTISDDSGYIDCLIWGNFFYRERQFQIGDKFLFCGKVNYNFYERKIQFDYRDHKKFEFGDDEFLKYPLIPLYIL